MELDVPEQAAGERLDTFLGIQLGSRAQAQRLLQQGCVEVDGAPAPAKRSLLRGGERISVSEPAADRTRPEAADADYRVVQEDEHLLVIDKPAGVVVHPGRGNRTGTLSQALAARGAAGGEPWRAGIVHRLDKDTSGLLVVAKHEESHRRLKAALAARSMTREYVALVDGRPPARSGTIDAPLGRDRRDPIRISTDSSQAREAQTDFWLIEETPTASLLRVRLRTGRTHQIRAHFAAIGHPVSGDPLYGRKGRFALGRQFLHAARLAFEHPYGGLIDLQSELPEDLNLALAAARELRAGPPEVGEGRAGPQHL